MCRRPKNKLDPDWRIGDGGLVCPGCYRLLFPPKDPEQKILPEGEK